MRARPEKTSDTRVCPTRELPRHASLPGFGTHRGGVGLLRVRTPVPYTVYRRSPWRSPPTGAARRHTPQSVAALTPRPSPHPTYPRLLQPLPQPTPAPSLPPARLHHARLRHPLLGATPLLAKVPRVSVPSGGIWHATLTPTSRVSMLAMWQWRRPFGSCCHNEWWRADGPVTWWTREFEEELIPPLMLHPSEPDRRDLTEYSQDVALGILRYLSR